MAKPKITYTYITPAGEVVTFQSTMELNYVALILDTPYNSDVPRWGMAKKSKNYINAEAMGQSPSQNGYFFSLPHVILKLTVV